MPKISLIISTSPGRESHLQYCLEALRWQTFHDFEVIVVDDGSSEGQKVIENSAWPFTCHYLWRTQDYRLTRSRNRGFSAAEGELLVFIDVDILLNPNALAAYHFFLTKQPQVLFYGYYGNQEKNPVPSALFPAQQVNWFDMRLQKISLQGLETPAEMRLLPQCYAWGGNFALSKKTLQTLGGFNENFIGWGGEDLDFAENAIRKGLEIHFLLDVWGEHQHHLRNEAFHQLNLEPSGQRKTVFHPSYTEVDYPVNYYASSQAYQNFLACVQNHYLKYAPKHEMAQYLGAQNA